MLVDHDKIGGSLMMNGLEGQSDKGGLEYTNVSCTYTISTNLVKFLENA
jgi:hypothetical protein